MRRRGGRTLILFGTIASFFLLCYISLILLMWPAAQPSPQEQVSIGSPQDEPIEEKKLPPLPPHAYLAHTFYYPWYGSLAYDGVWRHWNHEILLQTKGEHPHYVPPDDVGANFYPLLGPYSSNDENTIRAHMQMLYDAHIGVLCTSWYPHDSGDDQMKDSKGWTDALVSTLLDIAEEFHIKINFHVEPYKGRNGASLARDIKYITERYGKHPSFHRHNGKPVFYVYDSYLTPDEDWREYLKEDGKNSIRKTNYDAIVIGLIVQSNERHKLQASGFDGAYTYFASRGFTFGSEPNHWEELKKWFGDRSMMFIPCIGPGYIDTRIRPWNAVNTKGREEGNYYAAMFQNATKIRPPFLAITSFNEWHEGTQIEPAIPKTIPSTIQKQGDWPNPEYKYEDYEPHDPYCYLNKTRQYMIEWAQAAKLDN